MIVAGFIDGASFFLSGLMPNYELFIVCKVIQGSVSLLFFSAGYVLGKERLGTCMQQRFCRTIHTHMHTSTYTK